jgi:UDPglucose 6-dehydrogenase
VKGADGLLITNDWQTYRRPDFLHLQKLLKHPHIFDGKDLLPYRQIKEEGLFAYYSIARPNIKK